MSTWTILFLFEVGFRFTTGRVMRITGVWVAMARGGIDIHPAEFLRAFPTPTPPTSRPNHKPFVIRLETTRKNVIARVVLQTPSSTPRALFGIICGHPIEIGFSFLQCLGASWPRQSAAPRSRRSEQRLQPPRTFRARGASAQVFSRKAWRRA